MEGKKALVILTNEAFLPKGGHGGHPSPSSHNQQKSVCNVPYGPSAWTSPIPTIHQAPMVHPSDLEPEDAFAEMHRKTGIDILEVGYFWLHLYRQHKIEVTFASPRGGPVALDPFSIDSMEKDDKLKRELKDDREFMLKLGHTYPISWVDPKKFDLVLVPGGHGAMFDLPEHDHVADCVSKIYQAGGYICAIGHGASALINVKDPRSTNEYIIKGKRLTCYSNDEEREKRLEHYLPFLLEDKLRERGAKVETAKPFQPNVIVDERILTAQSWPSITQFVEKIVAEMRKSSRH